MQRDPSPTDPPLLTLSVPLTAQALDAEISAIAQGRYPPWRLARQEPHDHSWSLWHAISSLLALGILSPAPGSLAVAPVRTVVLEHTATHRRRTLVFEFLGLAHGQRLWRRAEDPARARSPDGCDPPGL